MYKFPHFYSVLLFNDSYSLIRYLLSFETNPAVALKCNKNSLALLNIGLRSAWSQIMGPRSCGAKDSLVTCGSHDRQHTIPREGISCHHQGRDNIQKEVPDLRTIR